MIRDDLLAVHGDGNCHICGQPRIAEGLGICSYPHARLPVKPVDSGSPAGFWEWCEEDAMKLAGKTITGTLEAFWETGTEGIWWSVDEQLPDPENPNYRSRDGLHILKNGDHLVIRDDKKTVIWEGTIDFDYKTCVVKYGWQAVRGMYVHGVQKGVDPETWFDWFRHIHGMSKHHAFIGVLRKKT